MISLCYVVLYIISYYIIYFLIYIVLSIVGGCRTKEENIDLSWWDSIEVVSTIAVGGNSSPTAYDFTKGFREGKIAIVTNNDQGVLVTGEGNTTKETLYVYRVEFPETLNNYQEVKEIFKRSNPLVTVHDVSIQGNMLVYSSNYSKTGGNYLTLVNLEPSSGKDEMWRIMISDINYLRYIRITSSAFLGIYQDGDIVICGIQELLNEMVSTNKSPGMKSMKMTNKSWALNRPVFCSDDSLSNREIISAKSISLDTCGSFAFLSNGNGDTLRLYYSPSLLDLTSGHRIKESSQSVNKDENDETSLC